MTKLIIPEILFWHMRQYLISHVLSQVIKNIETILVSIMYKYIYTVYI